jgi:predicted AAA+ superfamily ATPase
MLSVLPQHWKIYDMERTSDHEVVARDPDLFLRLNSSAIAIDEAQLVPPLFSALRVAIDQDRNQTGRYVLTGSSSPDLVRSISESLAGRIGIIEMAPFSWHEVNGQDENKFSSLIINRAKPGAFIESLQPEKNLNEIHDYWFKGGYPEPWLKRRGRFRNIWMNQYIQAYVFRDIARLFPGLDQNKFRLFINFLSGLSGTILNYSDIARSLSVSAPTARDYLQIAHGTFLWRQMPPYEKNVMKRVVKRPKGYMRDSGLLHHLLRLPDVDSLLRNPRMGFSWEGMVTEEIIRGLQSRGASFDYYYYRTSAGAEVDLVLEGEFGLIPVEIKYQQTVNAKALRPIKDFMAEHGCRIGIVINNDERVQRYDENLVGIPFAAL